MKGNTMENITKTTPSRKRYSLKDRGTMPRFLFHSIQKDLNTFTERDREEYVAKEKAKAAALKARS